MHLLSKLSVSLGGAVISTGSQRHSTDKQRRRVTSYKAKKRASRVGRWWYGQVARGDAVDTRVPGGEGRLVIARRGVRPKAEPWSSDLGRAKPWPCWSARPFSRRAKQRWGKQRVTSVGCTRNTAWRSHSAPQQWSGRPASPHEGTQNRVAAVVRRACAGRVPFTAPSVPPSRCRLPWDAACHLRVQAQSTTLNHDRPWPISSPVSVSVSVSARLSRALAARAFEA